MKILQWNLENFFIDLPSPDIDVSKIDDLKWLTLGNSFLHKNKPLPKLEEIAKILKAQAPDVCVLQEVAGRDSLEHFNRLFLESSFEIHMLDSNSTRGIDIAFLVKKAAFDSVDLKSNRKMKLTSKVKEKARFCRDVPELHVVKNGKKLAILGIHLKSKISTENDFFGIETRASEVQGILRILKRLRKEKIPTILAGDFNGFLQKGNCEYEFEDLLKAGFEDYHEVLGTKDRTTFVRMEPYQLNQLDYILIDGSLKESVHENSGVIPYLGFYDIPLEHPRTWKEKLQLPSDHYPQVLVLNHFFQR